MNLQTLSNEELLAVYFAAQKQEVDDTLLDSLLIEMKKRDIELLGMETR